jgi:hypothetical protein
MFLVWMVTEMFLINDYSTVRYMEIKLQIFLTKIDTKKENFSYWLMGRDNIWNWI